MTSGELNDMMSIIKKVPVLLFDDMGSDYGKDFPKSQLRMVIDSRYSLPIYNTVVATNLNEDAIRRYDNRLGDRVLDVNQTTVIKFNFVSWRARTNGNGK